jgi:hypothetical protein
MDDALFYLMLLAFAVLPFAIIFGLLKLHPEKGDLPIVLTGIGASTFSPWLVLSAYDLLVKGTLNPCVLEKEGMDICVMFLWPEAWPIVLIAMVYNSIASIAAIAISK